jgi:hypothetical protein
MFIWAQLVALFKNIESEKELKPCYLSMIFYQVVGYGCKLHPPIKELTLRILTF